MKTVRTRTVLARKLRHEATDAEQLLWRALRENALPCKFRRQHPIGRRIADFACPARKLVIELDGSQHVAEQVEDVARSAELAAHGYRVIRFWNNEVVENLHGSCGLYSANSPVPHLTPTLSAQAEREKRAAW